MTCVTFGFFVPSLTGNMSVKHKAMKHALEFQKAANADDMSFYVDNCPTVANSVEEATDLN